MVYYNYNLRGSLPNNRPLKFRNITERPETFYMKQVTYIMNKNCDSFQFKLFFIFF